MSASAMLRARIADPVVVNGGADLTDAPTACLAIRYTERTALMVGWPIGVSTLTAITIMAGVK